MTDKPTTYADLTAAFDPAPGGRYARPATPVVGAGPLPLAVPQWSRDLAAMPIEEPLGIRVDDVPALGFPAEERLAREKAEAEAEQPSIPTLRRY